MIRYLLPENGNFYKANLHCHTTCSDGRGTPAEIKETYKDAGYSVVAYTDHDVLLPHNDLTDDTFVALNGFEFAVGEFNKPWALTKCCHLCLIALDEHNLIQPAWHRTEYLYGRNKEYRDQVQFDPTKPDYLRAYNADCVNDVIRLGKENGFFVTYNHPTWSLENYEQYSKYVGMDALEIINTGCLVEGYLEHNNAAYDDLLRQGKQLYCIAADDNHQQCPTTDPKCDRFGGYTMIKAKELTYSAIASALKNGEFYASEGPEIKTLWYDEDTKELHITTSPAARIICTTQARRTRMADLSMQGKLVSEAVFTLDELDGYARVTVMDDHGKCAYSNAFWNL